MCSGRHTSKCTFYHKLISPLRRFEAKRLVKISIPQTTEIEFHSILVVKIVKFMTFNKI